MDAFFVLSGYLITMLLLTEWQQSGRLDLAAFWGRRARRLLPALLLVVVVVTIGGRSCSGRWVRLLRGDGLAALFYVANWRMIFSGGDYFAQTASPSPLQHTWSLGIEEQFYLVWPLLLPPCWWDRNVRARRAYGACDPPVRHRSRGVTGLGGALSRRRLRSCLLRHRHPRRQSPDRCWAGGILLARRAPGAPASARQPGPARSPLPRWVRARPYGRSPCLGVDPCGAGRHPALPRRSGPHRRCRRRGDRARRAGAAGLVRAGAVGRRRSCPSAASLTASTCGTGRFIAGQRRPHRATRPPLFAPRCLVTLTVAVPLLRAGRTPHPAVRSFVADAAAHGLGGPGVAAGTVAARWWPRQPSRRDSPERARCTRSGHGRTGSTCIGRSGPFPGHRARTGRRPGAESGLNRTCQGRHQHPRAGPHTSGRHLRRLGRVDACYLPAHPPGLDVATAPC